MEFVMKEWQRPKTTRRYIHPPMAERMYTMWREGKIMFGENEVAVRNEYFDLVSSGIWFLNENLTAFDFHDAALFHREDGIPTHGLGFKLGVLDFTIEACSEFCRTPSCYIKVKVENNRITSETAKFGFILRTGKESELIFGAPDVYISYNPNLEVWKKTPSTWKRAGNLFTDGAMEMLMSGDLSFDFCEENGIASTSFTLLPGESREAVFTFNVGHAESVDYDAAKAEYIKAWEGELARINKIPNSVKQNKPVYRMIKNLTVQLLQCFTRPKGVDFVLARQGGLQRQVWTYETMPVIESLQRLGDFDDYIEPVIDTYFNEFATESGEIVPLAIPWAMATGTVLYSFGTYAVRRGDKAFFEKYRDAAYKAFLWIKNLRASVKDEPCVAAGLFPPLRACDDELVFQSWCSTDTFTLRGVDAFAHACAVFGDKDAGRVLDEAESYRARIMELWAQIRDAQKGDELRVPFSPRVSDEKIMETYHFSYPIAYFIDEMDLPCEEVERIYKTYEKMMFKSDGTLFNRMPDRKNEVSEVSGSTRYNFDETGKCIVWYVCTHEYHWFKYFMRHGMKDRCIPILYGAEQYAMSDEYYMCERYNQRDPYFMPWSPNASASGRLLNMLLDFYG